MTVTDLRTEKLEQACAGLLELMALVPNEPEPLRAFVGIAARWEDAHGRLRTLESAAKDRRGTRNR
jgi:regulator of sirC expression with transglutaminase-like and TPR domain